MTAAAGYTPIPADTLEKSCRVIVRQCRLAASDCRRRADEAERNGADTAAAAWRVLAQERADEERAQRVRERLPLAAFVAELVGDLELAQEGEATPDEVAAILRAALERHAQQEADALIGYTVVGRYEGEDAHIFGATPTSDRDEAAAEARVYNGVRTDAQVEGQGLAYDVVRVVRD